MRPLRIRCGDLVASVIAGAGVVGQFGPEGWREGSIFVEERVAAVTVAERKRGRGNVLGNPVRVTGLPVERREMRRGSGHVGDGTRETILEDAGRRD